MPDLKSTLARSNPYWISKHRYYELKHFCRQYREWQNSYSSLTGLESLEERVGFPANRYSGDPTARIAMRRRRYSDRMDMVADAADKTDPVIGVYIFEAVTSGYSYETMNARKEIPCSRGTYYDLYRKFFWILDKLRK